VGVNEVFQNLFVTKDFAETIIERTIVKDEKHDEKHDELQDQFLRSVEWVVSNHSHTSPVFVILSPFEVDQLLPLIRTTSAVTLHVYAARSSASMRVIGKPLRFSLPVSISMSWSGRLPQILDLFSGTLYLSDYKTYEDICVMLRLYLQQSDNLLPTEQLAGNINSNGFVKSHALRQQLQLTGPGFEDNPLPFVRQLIFLRRHGRSFLPSHMGRILYGRGIAKDHFRE
jgi:hypothetical protein